MRSITCRSRVLVVLFGVLLAASSILLTAAPQQKPQPAERREPPANTPTIESKTARLQKAERSETPAKMPTVESKTARLQKLDGFFPLYWDPAAGTLWMEIAKLDTEVLYVNGLSAGVGSNDIGLDRGQLSATRVVRFERVGSKVLMVQPNYRFRATGGNPDEERAVRESFAASVIWGFTIAAQTGGRVLVDLTDFLLRDATGVAPRLRPATFHVDKTRSAVYMPRTRVFPSNTEMEATLTFTAEGSTANAGGGVERGALGFVAPTSEAVTVRQHHSLVALPDANFKTRKFDPRAGFIDFTYEDYSAPLGASTTRRFIIRHRLQKKDPAAAVSEPIKPIVYYLDRAAPEPVRSALLEGANWWNQAFEAAGFRNAFRVELMPEDADPMDVRYNVIQWVHRSTRGWSYGGSVVDPRTGEIIQGHVTLGSLRVRQDYLIGVGLTTPYRTGNEDAADAQKMALERIRQLAPHEVGHAIGLSHNYYDSSLGYISVMDYPQPLAKLRPDGTLDLSQAYGVGIGEWDKIAVAWGYSEFPPGADEGKALDQILADAWAKDLRFLSNQDTDYAPRADQWANGTDPAAELSRMMEVRRAVLKRFGDTVIKTGQPLAQIEEPFVPMYLYHRYQVEAAASALGGLDYFYGLRGDGHEPWSFTPAAQQRAALDALLRTLAPPELVVPDAVLKQLPPRPDGYAVNRELFPRNTGLPFDALTPALVASDLTVSFLLRPDRAARLVNQHALDPSLPGLGQVIDAMSKAVFERATANAYEAEVARTVQRVVVERLMALAATAPMAQVRAIATDRLTQLRDRLRTGTAVTDDARAHAGLLAADMTRFLERPAEAYKAAPIPNAPPGAPIGEPGYQWLPPYGTGTMWWEWWDGSR